MSTAPAIEPHVPATKPKLGLRSRAFGRLTAYVGILANLFGLGYYLTLAKPTLSFIPFPWPRRFC
jgi:hypothetical protein